MRCAHCRDEAATVVVCGQVADEVVLVAMCRRCSDVARTATPGLAVRALRVTRGVQAATVRA